MVQLNSHTGIYFKLWYITDDVILIADSHKKIQSLFTFCQKYSKLNNFQFPVKKCEDLGFHQTFSTMESFLLQGIPDLPSLSSSRYDSIKIMFEPTKNSTAIYRLSTGYFTIILYLSFQSICM